MITRPAEEYYFEHKGFCEICGKPAVFTAESKYFRDSFKCQYCKSVPRQRAIWHYLNLFSPKWRHLDLHESSPGWDKVSQRLTNECPNYQSSQYDPTVSFGTIVSAPGALAKKYRSETLEAQTFADGCFDVVITQDVFEHIFNPGLAIREIGRTLKSGGIFIMTVPITNKTRPSQRRARLSDTGEVIHHLEPQYHGNPMNSSGSLVTIDWGYDIIPFFQAHSDLSFIMLQLDNIDIGVRADLCEVIVGIKCPVPTL